MKSCSNFYPMVKLYPYGWALLSSTATGFKYQQNRFIRALIQIKEKKNPVKTKVWVFENGEYIDQNEMWYAGGHKLDVVSTGRPTLG